MFRTSTSNQIIKEIYTEIFGMIKIEETKEHIITGIILENKNIKRIQMCQLWNKDNVGTEMSYTL